MKRLPPTQRGARTTAKSTDGTRPLIRPNNLRPMLWSLALFGLAVAILFAALSGRFQVQRVSVVGTGVPAGELIAASGVEGENIFTIRSDDVVDRLQSIPDAAVQRVETSFPDTVTIYARARVAMAAWRRGSTLYLLDANGRVIKPVARTELPIITSADTESSLTPGVIVGVRESMALLPAAPHGAIAGFTYDRNTGLTIDGAAGWRADAGDGTPQQMANRVATLASFLQSIKDNPNQPKFIDLRGRGAYAR